uniref:hypothetical protein n=1 Tax=Escherichia coli TaxID=562 RepID=UPI00200E955D
PTSNYTFESRQIAAMPSRRNGSISFNRANRSTMSMTSHRSQITSNDENYWRARMQADLSLQAEYTTHSTINSNSTQHSQTQPPASQHRVYLLN